MSKANASVAASKIGTVYELGCSEFVADVLGKKQKPTEDYTRGEEVTKA